jgi:hypothetical protein
VRALEKFRRAPQRLIERTERRAAVAGNEAGGVQARKVIALTLQDQQANERLCAGQVDAAGIERVLIVERNLAQDGGGRGHEAFLRKNRVFGTRGAWGRFRNATVIRRSCPRTRQGANSTSFDVISP